jgi:hypothetical protein
MRKIHSPFVGTRMWFNANGIFFIVVVIIYTIQQEFFAIHLLDALLLECVDDDDDGSESILAKEAFVDGEVHHLTTSP